MNAKRASTLLFMVAALYDGILGAGFLFLGARLFQWSGVTPPNHMGYVQFPAALLLVFAILFMVVALNPVKSRDLIPYGILLKVSYCGVVLFHWLTAGVPSLWKPFCLFDLVFLVAFTWAWRALRPAGGKEWPA